MHRKDKSMQYYVMPDGTVVTKRPTAQEAQSWADYAKDLGDK